MKYILIFLMVFMLSGCSAMYDILHPKTGVEIMASRNRNLAYGTIVTLVAVNKNTSFHYSLQWQVDGSNIPGETENRFMYVPDNKDVVTCVMTIWGATYTSNKIRFHVKERVVK